VRIPAAGRVAPTTRRNKCRNRPIFDARRTASRSRRSQIQSPAGLSANRQTGRRQSKRIL